MPKCSRCGEDKLPDDFYSRSDGRNGGLQSQCKPCRSKQDREKREKQENLKLAERNHRLLQAYGLSEADYQRLYAGQQGKCLICREFHEKLCIDHNHATDKIRGLLCWHCNIGISHLAENPERLESAAAYLRQTDTPLTAMEAMLWALRGRK